MPNKSTSKLDDNSCRWVHYFESALGWIYLEFSPNAVTRLSFGYDDKKQATQAWLQNLSANQTVILEAEHPIPSFAKSWISKIKKFAAGSPSELDSIPIDTSHLSPFGLAVTQACRKVGWGETASYKNLAQAVGSPQASRAVGGIMAKNRFPLIVPCHRITASNGKLTGFSAPGGLSTKEKLLATEGSLP